MKNTKSFYWGDHRRYNSHANRIKDKYGGRVQKVSINAGFTCPNRDGTKGRGGCTYCNNESFTPSYCVDNNNIYDQIEGGLQFLEERYKSPKYYVAYFQSYTNTYKPLTELKRLYEEALSHKKINGIVISTRPDCINEEILDYLVRLKNDYFVFLEYGIESCYNSTLKRINRGHTFEDSILTIQKTAEKDLHVTGHILFGLPGESKEDMLKEAEILSELPLNALKMHQLQVMKNTVLGKQYINDPDAFSFFELDEYIDFIISFMEKLNPGISIERLVSEAPPWHRLNKGWGGKRADWVQKKIESVMEEKDTWQGKKFKKS